MGLQEREVTPLKWGTWKFQTRRATLYHTWETFNCFSYLIFYFLPLILTVKGWILDCDQSPVSSFFQAVFPHQTCQQSGSPDWPTETIRPLWINVLLLPLGECGTLRALIWWSQQLFHWSTACSAETDIYWCVRSNLNHHWNHCWHQSYQSLSRQTDAKLSTLSLFWYFPMKLWQETQQQRRELCPSPASVPINQWFSNWRAADQAGQLRLKKYPRQRASSCWQSSKPSTAPADDLSLLLPGDWRGQHNGSQTEWGKTIFPERSHSFLSVVFQVCTEIQVSQRSTYQCGSSESCSDTPGLWEEGDHTGTI